LEETEQAAMAAGVITQEELERWHQSLEAANVRGKYFASIDQIMLAAQKAG
jgi:hypothetical protein